MVYSLNLLQIHQLTPRQWQSGHRKRRGETKRGWNAEGSGGKGARGGHFIKRRPSCGQINAFPLRTNKFPRDADDASTTTNNKCQQKTKFFSLSLFLLHHHHHLLLLLVELLLVPLLLLHFWLPTALGSSRGKTWSTTKLNKCTACRSSVRQFLVNCFTRSFSTNTIPNDSGTTEPESESQDRAPPLIST